MVLTLVRLWDILRTVPGSSNNKFSQSLLLLDEIMLLFDIHHVALADTQDRSSSGSSSASMVMVQPNGCVDNIDIGYTSSVPW